MDSIVKYCIKMKTKLPSGSNRSPGTPYEQFMISSYRYINVLFWTLENYILLIQVNTATSPGFIEYSVESITDRLCHRVWQLTTYVSISYVLKTLPENMAIFPRLIRYYLKTHQNKSEISILFFFVREFRRLESRLTKLYFF